MLFVGFLWTQWLKLKMGLVLIILQSSLTDYLLSTIHLLVILRGDQVPDMLKFQFEVQRF